MRKVNDSLSLSISVNFPLIPSLALSLCKPNDKHYVNTTFFAETLLISRDGLLKIIENQRNIGGVKNLSEQVRISKK